MKDGIHPKFFFDARATCLSCGKIFTIGSTKKEITTDVCSACHPFYTGEKRFLDVKGRVEKFSKKQEQAIDYAKTVSAKKKIKEKRDERTTKSLKELLSEV